MLRHRVIILLHFWISYRGFSVFTFALSFQIISKMVCEQEEGLLENNSRGKEFTDYNFKAENVSISTVSRIFLSAKKDSGHQRIDRKAQIMTNQKIGLKRI